MRQMFPAHLLLLLSLLDLQKQFRRITMKKGTCNAFEAFAHLPKLACDFSKVMGEFAVLLFAVAAQVKAAGSSPLGYHRLVCDFWGRSGGWGWRGGWRGGCNLRLLWTTPTASISRSSYRFWRYIPTTTWFVKGAHWTLMLRLHILKKKRFPQSRQVHFPRNDKTRLLIWLLKKRSGLLLLRNSIAEKRQLFRSPIHSAHGGFWRWLTI